MKGLLPTYAIILSLVIVVALGGSRAVTVVTENLGVTPGHTVILDAGHGGIDGGATSVNGALESRINLEITCRLKDLLHLLGIQTIMVREDDRSIHTEGSSIAEKKISDLKNRVKIVNSTDHAVLVSIHQNYFSDGKYSGAQVFYNNSDGSMELAKCLQDAFVRSLNSGSKRLSEPANGIYLMQHTHCTGVLVECGFLSNYREEALLRNEAYQKNICCVIAATLSNYLYNETAS